MKVIIKQNEDFTNIIGSQTFNPRKIYRKSNFAIIVSYNQFYILHNSFTKETILLTDDEKYRIIDNFNYDNQDCKYLIKNWFFVPADFDELLLYRQFNQISILLHNKSAINNFTILTTTNCNARCFYCYENGIIHENMSEIIASDVANYITNVARGNNVNIKWFGGEPLVNTRAIDIISENLKNNNVNFTSSMITNGFLFNDEMIKRAKNKWNLKQVQITLDGNEEVYNKTKAYVYNNVSPYRIVINNIKRLLDAEIGVTIRVNIGLHNLDNIQNLIEEMCNKFLGKKNLYISPSVLYHLTEKLDFDQQSLLLNKLIIIKSFLLEKSVLISKNLSRIKNNSCMADRDNCVVITPTGQLTKCEHHIYDEICGDIYNGMNDMEVINTWKSREMISENCTTCEFLPNCINLKKCPIKSSKCNQFDYRLKRSEIEVLLIDYCKKNNYI